jgi:hypothetical protein
MTIWTFIRRTAAALSIAAALLPATASAGGDDFVLRRDPAKAVPVQVPADADPGQTSGQAGEAFDWGDAALGAGVGALVVGILAAGVGTARGRHLAQTRRQLG